MKRFSLNILWCFNLMTINLFPIAPEGLFAKYPNRYFVETGSHHGNGIKLALRSNFFEIRSIELNPDFYKLCCSKFQNYSKVKLYLGDSSISLQDMISDISESITFWLDGHYSGGKTSKGEKYSPILEELSQIKVHPIKDHTIIIDDVRLMGGIYFDFVALNQIKQYILTINPNYQFKLHDGYA
ncbi:MAG: hypothetical protein WD512_09265 [Candidatus Paceibacterota bacterium]